MNVVTAGSMEVHKGKAHKQAEGPDHYEWVASFLLSNGGSGAVKWIGGGEGFPPTEAIDRAEKAMRATCQALSEFDGPIQVGFDTLNTHKVAGARIKGPEAHFLDKSGKPRKP